MNNKQAKKSGVAINSKKVAAQERHFCKEDDFCFDCAIREAFQSGYDAGEMHGRKTVLDILKQDDFLSAEFRSETLDDIENYGACWDFYRKERGITNRKDD